jgi:hypothetical protein
VTGFVHRVALSSVLDEDEKILEEKEDEQMNDIVVNGDNIVKKDRTRATLQDEQSIQALQHSLFCAHVFDSIKREVVNNPTREHQNGTGTHSSGMMRMQQGSRVAWLSSEMEDNFLPAPSLMAGGLDVSSIHSQESAYGTLPLSVIHCHEGEVKVQLNSEYALTVRLIDIQNSREFKRTSRVEEEGSTILNHDDCSSSIDSGSQSREQIDILCRLLLLHAQFVFHDHHKQSLKIKEDEFNNNETSKRVDYSAGMMLQKQNTQKDLSSNVKRIERRIPPPNILQSCVALGSKVLLERHVRRVLKVREDTLALIYKTPMFGYHLV